MSLEIDGLIVHPELDGLEELKEIAYECEFPISEIIDYYERIKNCSCVRNRDKQSLIDCLYLIVYDRVSINCIINEYDPKNSGNFNDYMKKHYKKVEDSISEALYRVYGDAAIEDLPEQCQFAKIIKR